MIYTQLMDIDRPVGLSNNDWAKRAGVNTSFFTNLKNGSEPSVGNLRAVLSVVDISLPEFFAQEAEGRLIRPPSQADLEDAIRRALPAMPRKPETRARYLAEVVSAILALPARRPSIVADEQMSPPACQPTAKPVRAAKT
jgi:hypothetical protein